MPNIRPRLNRCSLTREGIPANGGERSTGQIRLNDQKIERDRVREEGKIIRIEETESTGKLTGAVYLNSPGEGEFGGRVCILTSGAPSEEVDRESQSFFSSPIFNTMLIFVINR